MADRIEERSGGQMIVQVFPNEQLGNEKECIEALQLGYLAMTKVSSAPMESFRRQMKVFGVPYLFRDSKHFWKVLDGPIGKELLLAGESKRLRGLCYYDAGARSFYTKDHAIHAPADSERSEDPRAEQHHGGQNDPGHGRLARLRSPSASCTPRSTRASSTVPRTMPHHSWTSRHYEVCRLLLPRRAHVPARYPGDRHAGLEETVARPAAESSRRRSMNPSSTSERLWAEQEQKDLQVAQEQV